MDLVGRDGIIVPLNTCLRLSLFGDLSCCLQAHFRSSDLVVDEHPQPNTLPPLEVRAQCGIPGPIVLSQHILQDRHAILYCVAETSAIVVEQFGHYSLIMPGSGAV
jgi:hypothetical protein